MTKTKGALFIVKNLIFFTEAVNFKNIILSFLAFSFIGIFSPIAYSQQLNPLSLKENGREIIIESQKQSSDSSGDVFTAFGNVKVIYPEKGIVATSRQLQYLKK